MGNLDRCQDWNLSVVPSLLTVALIFLRDRVNQTTFYPLERRKPRCRRSTMAIRRGDSLFRETSLRHQLLDVELATRITIVSSFHCIPPAVLWFFLLSLSLALCFIVSFVRDAFWEMETDRIRGNVSKYCVTANRACAFELRVTNAPSLVVCLVFARARVTLS